MGERRDLNPQRYRIFNALPLLEFYPPTRSPQPSPLQVHPQLILYSPLRYEPRPSSSNSFSMCSLDGTRTHIHYHLQRQFPRVFIISFKFLRGCFSIPCIRLYTYYIFAGFMLNYVINLGRPDASTDFATKENISSFKYSLQHVKEQNLLNKNK